MSELNVEEIQKQEAASKEMLQLVGFQIGTEEFGVDIQMVKEINRMVEVTRVPNAAHYVEGVINLRGKVIPIIDLRRRLGMPTTEHSKHTRIIVVEIENKVLGFIVDSVSEVLRIDRNITEAPPPMASSIDTEFITAIAKLENRLLILLDLKRVISKDEINELAEIEM